VSVAWLRSGRAITRSKCFEAASASTGCKREIIAGTLPGSLCTAALAAGDAGSERSNIVLTTANSPVVEFHLLELKKVLGFMGIAARENRVTNIYGERARFTLFK
jgi:hypothetical protein